MAVNMTPRKLAIIAIPISVLERTGATLIPTPTKANYYLLLFRFNNSSTLVTLSSGNNSLYT